MQATWRPGATSGEYCGLPGEGARANIKDMFPEPVLVMNVYRLLALPLLLAALAACDETPAPPDVPAKVVEPREVVPVPAPVSSAKPAAVTPAAAAGKVRAEQRASSGKPALEKLPPLPLDLSLPQELVQQLEPGAVPPLTEESLLPPLFVEKPAEPGPYQLNGRLITNDRSENYWDSVEGAELQIEFRN